MTEPASPLGPLKRRFLRVMRIAALFSIAIAALAVVLVARGDSAVQVHMLIATALGVSLSVLLGIALMTLIFLSNRMGQDDAAGGSSASEPKDQNDSRP